MRPLLRTSLAVAAGAVVALLVGAFLLGIGSPDSAGEPSAAVAEPKPAPRPDHLLAIDPPAGAHPIVWVRRGERAAVRTEPGGGDVAEVAGRRTEFGSTTVFSVIRTEGEWAAVKTPALANDRLGWVRLDSRRLRAGWTHKSIHVDLSKRRAVLRQAGRALRSFTVTVGAPESPTPVGRFAVTDTFRGGLNPVYGCCAVALTANQPNLPSGWLGGNRIAIHGNGTGGPLGVAASNGCIRAADEDVGALVDEVALGTPVFVRE